MWEWQPDLGSPHAQRTQVRAPAPRVSSVGPPAHAGPGPTHWGGLWLSPEQRRRQGDQEWRVECCTWGGSTSRKKPLPPLGSHLDLGEDFRQISVNSEGDRGLSEQLASGLGQLTQLQPGSPVPGAQETSSKSVLIQHRILPRRLVWPALLLSGTGPKLPFSTPFLSLVLLTNLPPWSPSFQLYYEFSRWLVSLSALNSMLCGTPFILRVPVSI